MVVATGILTRERSSARLARLDGEAGDADGRGAKPGTRQLSPYPQSARPAGSLLPRARSIARVSGYLKEWKVDIGMPVKAGQLLAEIDAPDLDQQLLQVRADLLNMQSTARLSEATLKRRQTLADARITSQQDLDERMADLASKQAAVKSGQANVDRLEALASYKMVTAPFDGFVTARDTDVGALINSGSTSSDRRCS